jgi:hypothetical protein
VAQRRLRTMRGAGMRPTVSRMFDVLSYAIVLAVSVAGTAFIMWELRR